MVIVSHFVSVIVLHFFHSSYSLMALTYDMKVLLFCTHSLICLCPRQPCP